MAELPKLDFEDVPRTHPTPPSPSLGHARARKRPGKQVARRGSRIGKVGAGAGEEPPDEVRDRSSSVGRACTRLRTALQEYLMYHFWMPLTGLVAVGSAFTVQPWLSICDLVVGLLLLHSQIFQFAFQRCCSKWTEVDNALVLASLMLSILTLIVRIAQTSGKEVWFFDVIYLMTALVAVVCATCRGGAPNSAPDLRQVPASPVLWLCLLAATTAPPCVASLPYALMFLKLLDSLLTNSWQSLLPISYRWSLAILTSTHIVTLLVLNFMSWSQIAIPSGMLGVFGELGRTIVLFKDSITTCIHSSSMNCLSREESLWPGLHLASVMLLHFLLTNAGEGRSSEPTMAKSTSASSSTVMQSSDILTRILRTLGVLVLLSYCLAFPSLLTLPLLLLYVWKSFSSARLAEAEASRTGRSTTSSGCCTSSSGCCATTAGCCSRCRCCSRRYREDDVKGSESSLYESSGCGVAHGWARYIALVFVFFYVYNVLEELLDHLWPEAAETLTSLRLRVLTGITGIDLVRALGLTVYRLSEPHAAFAAFTPQALMLLALAGIQALLEGGFSAEMSPWLSSIDKNGRNLWVYISRQTPAELPMLVALVGILMTTSAAFGETPVLLVAYALVWAKVVCGKLEVGQPRTWCWLQSLAQLGLVVMSLLYLVAPALTGRSSEAVQTLYKAFPELKREHYLKIVLPHLVLGCCAYLERLRIAQVTILTVQGRLRVDTLESIETASSWGVESTISRSSTQSRCLRALIRYKNLMVAKLRKWTDELICIFVLVLSFAAALVPGTDIHSLALLLGTGPALLLYNTRGTYRARKLDCGYFVLRFSTALMFVFRLTAASRLIDWPDDTQWPISLKELGVIRPLWDPPMKLAMLGMIAVFSRVAIIATMRREEDDRRTEEVDQVAEEPPMSKPAERVEEEKPATSGVEEKPAEESQSSTFTSEIEAEIPDEHSGNTQEIPKEETTVSIYPSPRIQRPSVRFAPSTVEAVHRDKLHRLRVHRPGMEERILTWLIPSWMEFMPLNMHVYLSALLLVLVFALSIQEVNILSFLMMLAVICLCGWSNRWVQAGNVFSCTTLAVMWLQYLARFRYLENLATSDGTSDVWLRRVGLECTSSQVEKHCAILFVCILQKQYWYRGRFSKARPVVCPSFVADHADMAGFFGLISVAVIRRHALSTLLVLGALPWVVREELPFKESAQRHAHTKWWLRWFRLVLFFILVIEVSLRLLLTFNLGEEVGRDQLVNWICNEYWKGASHPRAFDSCLVEFTHWIDSANAQQGSTPLMLMEFLCLFFLGMVQQLLECTSSQTLEAETLQRKKLTVLYWWPLLVWCCAFTLSLARGTLLGLCFLVLLLGVTFSNSSSLPTRRRWVWRTRLFALLFLLIGLAFQSPLLPCSRAACQDGIHQIYVTQDECVKMEAFDLSLVGSEAQSAHCGAPDHGASLGHDTSWTLFVQILGVRRVSGASLWEGIAALFLSQLGQLVLLIAATTVQLRMYSSRLFAKYLDVFVEESEDVIFARAQRFATEFYCGAKLQELASRNRVKALVEKLARTKKKIQDLLRYNQEFMDSKSTGHSAAILKPANSKQVTEILKYAGEKNLTILPLMKEKNSAGKAVWNSASSQQLSEILKNAEKGKTGGEGVLHDELVLSVLRTLQLDPGEDEDKKAAIATIQDMLELRTDKSSVRGRLKYFINKSHEDDDVAIEELQLSCGLLKKDAEKVIKMFASNASIGKKYANLLQQITCGRLNPDGDLLRIQVQQLLDAVQVHQEISGQVQKRRNGLSPPHSSFSTASLKGVRSRTESDPSVAEEKEKGFEVVIWERIQGFIGPYLKAIADWWEGFKCSQLLGRVICDHAWLGLDEEHYRLNAINVTLDELCEHRRGNNLPRILWKAMLSNMPLGSALFCTLAFVMNRSLLDALRLLLVVFACLRSYPFPANWLWTFLKIYSTGVLVLRTLYDLPVVCAGFQLRQPRFPEAPRLMLEPEDSYQWCPVFTEIGIDILLGFAKRSTASSLEGTELWIDAVWADHLCIWAVLMHQWILQRYGVGRFVVFDAQSQRLWLRKQGDQCPAPSPLSSQEVRLKEENLGTWGSHFREDHKELVKHWWTLRQTFIREFEEQDELFHQYQEQFEEESSDSSSEAEQDPTDSGTLETTVSGEPEAEESAPRKPKMHRSSEVAQLSMSNMGGSSSARISRFRVRTGSVPSLDTALMLHSSKSVIAYEWIMEWAKARGRRVGLFASCKAPRDLEHIDPPRLLFPVLRSRENPEEEHEDQEEHRWNQALQWAQVLAYRFLSRQNRLYQRTGHRLGVAQDEQVIECEICTMFVEPNERHWSCGSCNYHICKNCANEIMQGRRPREKLMKLGISLYIAKYFLAFFLLCYALLNNKAILKEEERSFSQSLQENNFSVGTLLLIVAHMTILLSDRIFFKAHYSMRSHATLHIIELVNLGFILAEFVFLHYHTMAILWTSANPREATISLASDWELCIYYLCGMLYITICMMQIKHGLPALGTDSLRPKTIELFSPSSIYTEKLWYYFFLVHYNLPFVDDLRVIVDWTVVPTSLDLWMYWKVEDAHSSFYRSRHLMFVRGQSYYAEERDLLEKFYNGWAILCGVVLVILMPIIVFSPFSPFPNTVLVEHADMALGMTVASSCYGASRQQLCRYVELELFAAPALQIQRYNSSQTQKYLQDNPRVNTDIDIQDIKWPWFSKEAMHASPALVEEVQKIMDEATTGLDIAVVFELRYSLQRSVLGVSSHRRSLCSCAPSCGSFAAFPARVSELCSAGEVSFSTPMDEVVNQTRSWWREATESSSQEATVVLPKMWSPRVNLGNAGLTEKEEVTHFVFGLASEASRCAEDAMGLVSCARDRWGSLRNSNHSKVEENATLQLKVELEKSVNVQGVTGESTTYTTAMGLYVAVVWLVGKYLRAAFQGAAKQAIYDEIPDVHVFLDLIEAIKMAREHGDLRVEFELYYCLMQVLRSTHILLRIGGHEPRNYGIGRTDRRPPQAVPDGEVVHL